VRGAISAEWAKTRSDPAMAWLLVSLVALSVAVSAVTISVSRCPAAGCGQDPARISLAGLYLGQALAAVAGTTAMAAEYGTGMIRVSLAAIPRRGRLLAAKALVLGGSVLAASVVTVGAAMLAGHLILPANGFTAGRGFDLDGAGMWRAAGCAVVYLTLVALLGLGVATAVRDAIVATAATLGLLYLFPVAASLTGDPAVARRLEQISPMFAGLDSQSTTGLDALPLSPWQGLGVVALWAAGTLLAGWLLLRARDA
jgi:ABC-2 type transport system permease protein